MRRHLGLGFVTTSASKCTAALTRENVSTAAVLLDILAVFYVDITEAVLQFVYINNLSTS